MTGSGAFTTTAVTTSVHTFNGYLIVTQDLTLTATGTLNGVVVGTDTVILNAATGNGYIFGSGTYTGTVGTSLPGTAHMNFAGTVTAGTIINIGFTLSQGTGGLSGLRATGTAQGVFNVGGTYTVRYSFNND